MAQANTILDALPAPIALLDATGTIVRVNDAWARFPEEHGAAPFDSIGMNYLAVCDAAGGDDGADGKAVAERLRGLLRGAEERFEYEYRCPTPEALRWFRLFAARGPQDGVVVMHIDITESKTFEEALRENAALLRNAQRTAALGYWHLDIPTQSMTLGDETCHMLGLGRCDTPLHWDRFLAAVHPDDRPGLAREMERVAASRGALDTQVRYTRGDGAERWLRIRAEVMFPATSTHRVLGTILDITERRAAGEAIRESEARHRLLSKQLARVLDGTPDVICVLDGNCRFVQLNASAQRVWGVPPNELVGRAVSELVVAEDREAMAEQCRKMRSSSEVSHFENRMLRADGTVAHVVWSAQWSEGDGSFFCVARDETAERQAAEANLRLSEQLHATLENMPDGFFTLGGDWRIGYVNRAAEKIAGAPREAMVGRVIWDIFPIEAQAGFREHYEKALRENRVVEFQEWSPMLQMYTHLRAVPTGSGLGVYVRDVTAEQRMQASLRASEERFERIAEATTDAMWDWDLITEDLWWSPGFQRIFGYALDSQVTPVSFWSERIHPDDRVSVMESLHAAFSSDVTHWTMEYRFRKADGRYVWVRDHGSIVRAAGAAVRMVGGFSDITHEREARQRLEEHAQLLDTARDAIHVRELTHRIVYMNRSAEELYGWPAAEAIGKSMERLVYRDSTAFRNAHHALMAHGEWAGEMEVVSRDGRRRRVETRWTLLRDPEGNPRRILAIDTDVTERRELEQQVIRSQRLDSIGTLAGGIAHDLNNVFTPILMAVNLMRGGATGSEQGALLDAIGTSAERGVQMVGRLLAFARGVEGERKPIRLADVIGGVVRIVSETFPKNIVVQTEIEKTLPSVLGDATQLHQVLLNLCVNARDAMTRGGMLRITASRIAGDGDAAGEVLLEVADTGVGIVADHMDRLWDPFFTTKSHGTGLGLPTSLAIVKAHGGAMRVRSTPGEGSCFSIVLPAAPDVAVRATNDEAVDDVPEGSGQRILVVDDEAPVRRICRQALERHGYRVTEAADGREALQAYQRNPHAYDLVLLDMMMPVMDGPETIEALRKVDPDVRIVPTSGYVTPDRMAAVEAAGMRCFLAKPYTPESLLRVVANGLRA